MNELRECYRRVPEHTACKLEQTLRRTEKIMTKIDECDTGISFWAFFWSQLRFIKKHVWLIQFAVVAACGICLYGSRAAGNALSGVSAILPLSFLAGVGELSRAFENNTAELEMSSKFTLHRAMLSRLTLLGLSDVLVLTAACAMVYAALSVSFINIFMYLCVPFLVTTFGCLCILNHVCTKRCAFCCVAWGAGITALSLLLSNTVPALYEKSLFWCWCVLFAAALAGAAAECAVLLKNCKKGKTEAFCFRQESY